MLAILPALALVQPYNLRGEDINVTIGPHPGGFPHHVENVTYDCRSEIELCRELFDAVEMGDRAEVARMSRVQDRKLAPGGRPRRGRVSRRGEGAVWGHCLSCG